MADTSTAAVMTLARQDLAQLRLTGMILRALVERKVLKAGEAAAIVEDAIQWIPKDNDAMTLAYQELVDQFR